MKNFDDPDAFDEALAITEKSVEAQVEAMNYSEMLRNLANWFDLPGTQAKHPEWAASTEVQDDLRRIADEIERMKDNTIDTVYQENRALEAEIERLRARWGYIKSHPGSARHLLSLLEAGRGSGDDFDKMIDRIVLAMDGGGDDE